MIVDSPDVEPNTIHATPVTDSYKRWSSATVDWSPGLMYSHIKVGLAFSGRTRQNKNTQSTVRSVSPASFWAVIRSSSPSATLRAGLFGTLF